jgi:hypothetical protein
MDSVRGPPAASILVQDRDDSASFPRARDRAIHLSQLGADRIPAEPPRDQVSRVRDQALSELPVPEDLQDGPGELLGALGEERLGAVPDPDALDRERSRHDRDPLRHGGQDLEARPAPLLHGTDEDSAPGERRTDVVDLSEAGGRVLPGTRARPPARTCPR